MSPAKFISAFRHIIPKWTSLFLLLVILLSAVTLDAQSINKLKKKQKQLRREILATSHMLKKTEREKTQALNRLLALNVQISSRRQLIESLHQEVDSLAERIEQTSDIIDILSNDLSRLQKEMGTILRAAAIQHLNQSKLLLLFSADSFNQAFRRWLYLRQYNKYRTDQLHLIEATARMLSRKKDELLNQKQEMELLLNSVQTQSQLLQQEKSKKKQLLSSLRKNANKLRRQLARREKEKRKLNAQIATIIARAEKKHTPASENKHTRDEAAGFARAKGKLSWPASGYITGFFGKHPHPMAPKVMIANNGIDIRLEKDATVRNVFKGRVIAVEGAIATGLTVLIKHGNYYTVYSNLKEAFIKKGQEVGTLDTIGIAGYDPVYQYKRLHFEIWKGKTALNPTRWLRR